MVYAPGNHKLGINPRLRHQTVPQTPVVPLLGRGLLVSGRRVCCIHCVSGGQGELTGVLCRHAPPTPPQPTQLQLAAESLRMVCQIVRVSMKDTVS